MDLAGDVCYIGGVGWKTGIGKGEFVGEKHKNNSLLPESCAK